MVLILDATCLTEFWTSKMSRVRWLWFELNDTHLDGPRNGRDMFTFDSFNLINFIESLREGILMRSFVGYK